MKRTILLICLAVITTHLQAQTTDWLVLTPDTAFHVHVKQPATGKWLSYAILTTSVLSNALGDGLNSREYYAQGHALNALSIGGLLGYPFSSKVTWKTPVTYILIRYALFDLFYNIGAHRDWNYRGGKNYYNEGVGHIPLGALNASKAAAFVLSIAINIK